MEFEYKAQVCDNVDGVILDHDIQPGKPGRRAPAGARGEFHNVSAPGFQGLLDLGRDRWRGFESFDREVDGDLPQRP